MIVGCEIDLCWRVAEYKYLTGVVLNVHPIISLSKRGASKSEEAVSTFFHSI